MPASRDERDKLVECATNIQHLKEKILDLEQKFEDYKKGQKASKQFISTRNLTILMIVATVLAGALGSFIMWLLTKSFP